MLFNIFFLIAGISLLGLMWTLFIEFGQDSVFHLTDVYYFIAVKIRR